jgi:hypothetical protein
MNGKDCTGLCQAELQMHNGSPLVTFSMREPYQIGLKLVRRALIKHGCSRRPSWMSHRGSSRNLALE